MTNEKFISLVQARVKNNGQTWLQADSAWMVAQLFEDETGEVPDETVMKFVREIANPSQFAQTLERKKIIPKRPSKRQKHDDIFGDFVAPAEAKSAPPEQPKAPEAPKNAPQPEKPKK